MKYGIWKVSQLEAGAVNALVGSGYAPLAAMVLALYGKGILALLLMANDIYVCGVVPPVFVGMLLYRKARFRPWGVAAAMAAGGLLGLTATLSDNSAWSFAGLGVSLLGSLAAARRREPVRPKAAEADPGI